MGFDPLNSGDYHKFELTSGSGNGGGSNHDKRKVRLVINWGYTIKFTVVVAAISIIVAILESVGRY